MTEENHQQLPPSQSGTTGIGILDLAKLYLQQFGLLTFGTITVLIMQQVIVTPQLDRSNAREETLRQLEDQLHKAISEAKELAQHQRQTAEIQDRVLLRTDK